MSPLSRVFTRRRVLLAGGAVASSTIGNLPCVSGDALQAVAAADERRKDQPAPQDYGSNGKGGDDDTEAFQRAIDEVRNNCVWPSVRGRGDCSFVRVPAGRYNVTRSLDFTSDGSFYGLGLRGEGMLNTVIMADLAEPYPVLDLSGMAYAVLSDFQIRSSGNSLARCAVLLAHLDEAMFHNRQATISSCLFAMPQKGSRFQVASVVVQNADLLRTSNVHCEGEVGASIGRFLPRSYHGGCVASTSRRLTLDSVASQVDGFYNSLSVTIVSGPAIGQVRRIVHYSGKSRVAEVDRPWKVLPDAQCECVIWAVSSKYKHIPGAPDQTNYWINASEFYGRKPLQWNGGACLSLSDVYVGAGGAGGSAGLDSDKTGILLSDTGQDFPFILRGRNVRVENQTDESEFYAVTSDTEVTMLDLSGELDIVPKDWRTPTGAVLRTRGRGSFYSININGWSNGLARLFSIGGNVRRLVGMFRVDGGPGRLDGTLGSHSFDWGNPTKDEIWKKFFESKLR